MRVVKFTVSAKVEYWDETGAKNHPVVVENVPLRDSAIVYGRLIVSDWVPQESREDCARHEADHHMREAEHNLAYQTAVIKNALVKGAVYI